jgi:hypothetical protein
MISVGSCQRLDRNPLIGNPSKRPKRDLLHIKNTSLHVSETGILPRYPSLQNATRATMQSDGVSGVGQREIFSVTISIVQY